MTSPTTDVVDPAHSVDPKERYLSELVRQGLLLPMGVDGLYGRSGQFEDVIDGCNTLITRWGKSDGAEVMRFPPGLNRRHFEESEYLKSFPQLAGTIHSFMGGECEHHTLLKRLAAGDDWTGEQQATDIVVTPAACYPVYPTIAARGPLPSQGKLIDVYSYCFRHEPSKDPARMQLFRMREYVRIGSPREVREFREIWLERGRKLIASLQLPFSVDVANDPFFGRAGRMLSVNQRDQALKFELLIPITSEDKLTACLSFNYHQDHFGQIWKLSTDDGEVAHTGCVGFGMERIAIALFKHHGFDVEAWPADVRTLLWG